MNTPSLPKQFALDIGHTPKASLENYLPGSDCALVSSLQALCDSWKKSAPKEINNPLNHRWMYWWGPEGSGRTHLLQAMMNTAEIAGLKSFSLTPTEPITWVRLEEQITALAENDQASVITVDDVDRLDDRLGGGAEAAAERGGHELKVEARHRRDVHDASTVAGGLHQAHAFAHQEQLVHDEELGLSRQ